MKALAKCIQHLLNSHTSYEIFRSNYALYFGEKTDREFKQSAQDPIGGECPSWDL